MKRVRRAIVVVALMVAVFGAMVTTSEAAGENYVAVGAIFDSKTDIMGEAGIGLIPGFDLQARVIGGKSSQWDARIKWAGLPLPGVGLSVGAFGFDGPSKNETGTLVGIWGETGIGPATVHGEVAYSLANIDGERLLATLGVRYPVHEAIFVSGQLTRGLARKDPTVMVLVGTTF